jgi:hypothetical protein
VPRDVGDTHGIRLIPRVCMGRPQGRKITSLEIGPRTALLAQHQEETMRQTNAKKLRLERETVAVLQSVELTDINGGVDRTGISACAQCPTGQGTQVSTPPGCPPPRTDIFTGKPPVL